MAKLCADTIRRDPPLLEVANCTALGTTTDGYLPTGGLARVGTQPVAGRMVDQQTKSGRVKKKGEMFYKK